MKKNKIKKLMLLLILYSNIISMGITKYHTWLKTNHSNCFTEIKEIFLCEHLYIDINFALHACVSNNATEELLIKRLIGFIKNIVAKVNPTKTITLATDGQAPYAKMMLQKKRRTTNIFTDDKYITPLHFSPGTIFMNSLGEKLDKYFLSLTTEFGIEVIKLFNSPNEAEIKLFQQILINNKINPDDKHVILSSDADVIVIACSVKCCDKILICIRQSKIFTMFSIDQYIKNVKEKSKITSNFPNQDITMISLFYGNDYLPKLNYTNPDNLWKSYYECLSVCKTGFFNKDETINNTFMQKYMMLITINLRKQFQKMFVFSQMNMSTYDKYIKGLIWCHRTYVNACCYDYDFIYTDQSPHALGIYFYLSQKKTFVNFPLKVNYIPDKIYASLILPRASIISLVDKKMEKIVSDKSLDFLFESENCKICDDYSKELKKLNNSLTGVAMFYDDDESTDLTESIDNISHAFNQHKKNHKNLTMKDFKNAEKILLKKFSEKL